MLRLPQFELLRPTTATEAVALLGEHEGSMILAGGTDLLPNMKHELFTPKVVVSLEDIAELRGVRADSDGTLRIGAMTRIADVAANELVQAAAPALAQATSLIA
ncbi:MAG: FAD binding domain-containing protein, partial [Planctomycetota bacterium]